MPLPPHICPYVVYTWLLSKTYTRVHYNSEQKPLCVKELVAQTSQCPLSLSSWQSFPIWTLPSCSAGLSVSTPLWGQHHKYALCSWFKKSHHSPVTAVFPDLFLLELLTTMPNSPSAISSATAFFGLYPQALLKQKYRLFCISVSYCFFSSQW